MALLAFLDQFLPAHDAIDVLSRKLREIATPRAQLVPLPYDDVSLIAGSFLGHDWAHLRKDET
jgi:hypothetical protein